jgi:hypothetical protein
LGYSEPSSLDFYNGNGYLGDVPIPQSQALFPLMNNGPPPTVAPYNPQYTNPSSASMESLPRILAVAQAALEYDEYPTLKRVVETLKDPLPSLVNSSGNYTPKDPTTPLSESSSNCKDAVDRVKLRHLDNKHQAPTSGFEGLRIRSGHTNSSGHDHSYFYASPPLDSNSTMLSHGNLTSLDTSVVGRRKLEDLLIEDLTIRTHCGSMQSYVDLTNFLLSYKALAKRNQV